MMMDGSNESSNDDTRENHDHDYADRSKTSNGNNNNNNNGETTTGTGGGGGGGFLSFLKSQPTQISDLQFPLLLISVSSSILLIAVTSINGGGYALSVPSLSLCLSLSGFLVAQFREDLYKVYGKYLAHLLFTWNFIGASFLTFNAPFTTTGNGYFAAWATVAVSAMAMGFTADAFKDHVKGVGSLMGLCACSVVLIFSVMEYVGSSQPAIIQNASIYAMIISCLTIAYVLGILFCKQKEVGGRLDHIVINGQMRFNTTAESRTDTVEHKVTTMEMLKFGVLCLMTVLWFVLACLVTFRGPFTTTGNGYFSAWAGCACISFATYNAKQEIALTKKKMMALMNRPIDDDNDAGNGNGNGVEGTTGLSANNV